MKKIIKYISFYLTCFILMTSFLYIPNNKSFLLSSSAAIVSNPDYSYNAELIEDNIGMGNYAIENVEYLDVNGAPLVHYKVRGSGAFITMLIKNPIWDDFYGICCNMTQIDNNGNYTNFAITCSSDVDLVMTNSTALDIPVNGSTYYLQPINFYGRNNCTYDLYFSYYPLYLGTNYEVTVDTTATSSYQNRLINNDFEPLIDMKSSTSYTFNISDIFGYSPLMQHISRYYTNDNPYTGSVGAEVNTNSTCYYRNEASSSRTTISNCSFYSADFGVFNQYTKVSKTLDYFFNDFFFYIQKPSYRVDNTFFIYNYSYDESLNSFSSLTYQLRKDDKYYNVSYNGTVPNSKYMAFNCDDINNIIFDEYIYVDFKFTDNKFNPYDYGFTDENQTFTFTLGFDMNFVYYTEPLVATNGVYNFNFEKPSYVSADIEFSIVPPHLSLPVLAWVENAFIFLFFYCPIISDIISLLHFDLFFGALIDIIDIYTSSLIGDFVLGCIGFILFYGILKTLLPTVVVFTQSVYEDSQTSFNRKARKEEKQKAKYNAKQLKYKFKQIDKEYKNKEKRKKKGLPD